jgi:hypothetical protein
VARRRSGEPAGWGKVPEPLDRPPYEVDRLSQPPVRDRLKWRGSEQLAVGYDPARTRLHYADRYSLPSQYVIRVDDPRYPVRIVLDVEVTDQGVECIALDCVRRERARPVSLEVLRDIRVWDIIEKSLPLAAQAIRFRPDAASDGDVLNVSEIDVESPPDFLALFQERTKQPVRRGVPVDDRRLREAAHIYVAALPSRKPTDAVRRHFGVSRATAARYVRRARERGFMDEARTQHEEGASNG